MKILFCLVLCCASVPAQNPLTDSFMARYKAVRQNLIETAEAMPEDAYQFKLTPAQRPFSGWIAHTAMGNYHFCSAIKGEPPPDTAALHDMTAKAGLVKAIQESFDYCDAALQGLTDQKALTATTVDGKQSYPVQSMIALIASTNEHYGNLVGYLRSKGVTPPSSRQH